VRLPPTRAALLGPLLAGCYPGRITTTEGADRLRTAMYVSMEADHLLGMGVPSAAIFLSTSQLSCSFSDAEDPGEVAQDTFQNVAGLTREGALSLLLRVGAADGLVEGVYHVEPLGSAPESARWSEAFYMAVLESGIVDREESLYYYEVSDERAVSAQRDGEVAIAAPGGGELRRADALEGTFDLRDIGVRGHFTAAPCDADDAGLIELILNVFLNISPSPIGG